MPPTISKKDLQKLYGSDRQVGAVLDHFANRARNQRTTTVRRLMANITQDGLALSRGETVKVLKALEGIGCGEFKAGRKGHESRFEWHVSSKSVGQVAAGEDTDIDEDVPEADEASEDETDELLEHRFQLRPELVVAIHLPADLSQREAKRLATFIETLPFAGEH